MRLEAILTMTAMAALVAGCGPHPGKTVLVDGKGGSVTVDNNGSGSMTVKSNDGKTVVQFNNNGVGDVKTPDFAPLYPGAKVTGSINASTEGGMVIFQTSAKPEDVVTFYQQKSAAAGLAAKLNMTTEGTVTYMATTADEKKTLQVVASKSDTGTQAQITWGTKK